MIEALIAKFGYVAIALGTFFEGEVVVVISGIVARLGYLDLFFVLVIVFISTFIGDQTFFMLGREKGNEFLAKRPHIKARADKVHKLIDEHQNKILFGFRFLYGLRIPTLIALGTSKLSPKKFAIINLCNSVVWSLLFVYGGYFFGELFLHIIDNIKRYERPLFLCLAIVAVVVWIVSLVRNREEYE